MNSILSLRRGYGAARWLGIVSMSVLLSACVGESKSDEKQTGKIERSADVAGRWSFNYATAANSCGFPQNKSQIIVDVVQNGAKASFLTLKGATLLRGDVGGDVFSSSSSATIQIDGREYSYMLTTQLAIENNTLVGEEMFSFGETGGDVQCSGTTRINAVRSVNRKNSAVPNDALVDYEPNDTVASSVMVPVNANVTGVVDAASDRVDVYALPLENPGPYQIGVTGFGYSDLDIALVDKFHNLLASSENAFGLDEGVAFNVDATDNAMLYVIVSGFETGDAASEYTLQVTAP